MLPYFRVMVPLAKAPAVMVYVSEFAGGTLAGGVMTSAIATVLSAIASAKINVRILLNFFTVLLLPVYDR